MSTTDLTRTPSRGAGSPPTWRFLLRTTGIHAVTYLVVGIVAALVLDYESLFAEPVVRDYMKPFGSVALFVGPAIQVLRGALTALVLLPFRALLGARWGWLQLWLLLVVVGILSTSAAAPSSIEGVVYTRLPLWYHAVGLPEMLVQTLAFSVLVAAYERHPRGLVAALPRAGVRILESLAAASFAFVGYAIASVVFALIAGAAIDPAQNLTWEVQGLFVAPFVINGAIALVASRGAPGLRTRVLAAASSYALGVPAVLGYQALVAGSADPLYGLLAPVLLALVIALVTGRRRADADVAPGPSALQLPVPPR